MNLAAHETRKELHNGQKSEKNIKAIFGNTPEERKKVFANEVENFLEKVREDYSTIGTVYRVSKNILDEYASVMKEQKVPQVLSRACLKLLMSIRDDRLRESAIQSVTAKAQPGEFDIESTDDDN